MEGGGEGVGWVGEFVGGGRRGRGEWRGEYIGMWSSLLVFIVLGRFIGCSSFCCSEGDNW